MLQHVHIFQHNLKISYHHINQFSTLRRILLKPTIFIFHTPSFNQIILTPPPFSICKVKTNFNLSALKLSSGLKMFFWKPHYVTYNEHFQHAHSCVWLIVTNNFKSGGFVIRTLFNHSHEKTVLCD